MNDLFCPDCGEHCKPGADQCPECRFPLELTLVAESGELRIDKQSMGDWRRIAKILKRNGLRLKTAPGTSWYNHPAWWVLPALGFFMLFCSLVWGPGIVDSIWPPPVATRIVDLNAPSGELEGEGGGDESENISYLKDAF